MIFVLLWIGLWCCREGRGVCTVTSTIKSSSVDHHSDCMCEVS